MATDLSKKPQCQALLRHFRSGNTITQLEALRLFGIGRLASRITDLKCSGFDVQSQYEDVPTRHGKSRVKRYWLDC